MSTYIMMPKAMMITQMMVRSMPCMAVASFFDAHMAGRQRALGPLDIVHLLGPVDTLDAGAQHPHQVVDAGTEDHGIDQYIADQGKEHHATGQRGCEPHAVAHLPVDHPGETADLGNNPAAEHSDKGREGHQPQYVEKHRLLPVRPPRRSSSPTSAQPIISM